MDDLPVLFVQPFLFRGFQSTLKFRQSPLLLKLAPLVTVAATVTPNVTFVLRRRHFVHPKLPVLEAVSLLVVLHKRS